MRGLIPGLILLIVLSIGGTALAAHYSSAAGEAGANAGPIPDEAIRIRIIAKSDSGEDQAVKRAVRDRVSAVIESWGRMPSTIEEARQLIRSHLPDVQQAADEVLQKKHANYGAKVELGEEPFPAKTFEGAEYPAGNYEALLITLGAGEGANWWCVLFPPLCLAAATSADDASDKQTKTTDGQKAKVSGAAKNAAGDSKSARVVKTSATSRTDSIAADPSADQKGEKPKTEFFLWVLLKKLFAWIGSLFS